ncbi:MAG TPA: FAD-dependent oxidoreductase [Longimicrobiales bacterium]|nr:FAD-dependent oxidoreductase [Longimicrobiales bacterium]
MRFDVIVVGGGVVGAAVTYFLARDGVRVRLLEGDFIGGGTTACGMGHVSIMDDSPAQFALTARSTTLLAELAPALSPDCELTPCGAIWLAEDDTQLELVHAKHAWYRERGLDVEVLDPAALADAEPELRRDLRGGLLMRSDSVLYPPAFARWLVREAERLGADVKQHARVSELGSRTVVANGERFVTNVVVNAAGAWAPQLTPDLPIVPRKGHLVITDRRPGLLRHQLLELGYLASAHSMSAESVAFNVQPRVNGQVLIGSSRELVGWDGALNHPLLGRMLDRAAHFLPALERVTAIRAWTGFRPATPHKLPLIGIWQDGLWIAAGHEGLGITTALATGELIADRFAGRRPALDATPFAPRRAAAAGGAA